MGSGGMGRGRGGRGGIIGPLTFTFHTAHVLSLRYSLNLRVTLRVCLACETVVLVRRPRSFCGVAAVPHMAFSPSEDATTTSAATAARIAVSTTFAAAISLTHILCVFTLVATTPAAVVTLIMRLLDVVAWCGTARSVDVAAGRVPPCVRRRHHRCRCSCLWLAIM